MTPDARMIVFTKCLGETRSLKPNNHLKRAPQPTRTPEIEEVVLNSVEEILK